MNTAESQKPKTFGIAAFRSQSIYFVKKLKTWHIVITLNANIYIQNVSRINSELGTIEMDLS